MPFNEKMEWVNPDVSDHSLKDDSPEIKPQTHSESDLNRGYSICYCGAYKLLQAGFDADMYFCKRCDEDVAAPFEIFDKQELGMEVLGK